MCNQVTERPRGFNARVHPSTEEDTILRVMRLPHLPVVVVNSVLFQATFGRMLLTIFILNLTSIMALTNIKFGIADPRYVDLVVDGDDERGRCATELYVELLLIVRSPLDFLYLVFLSDVLDDVSACTFLDALLRLFDLFFGLLVLADTLLLKYFLTLVHVVRLLVILSLVRVVRFALLQLKIETVAHLALDEELLVDQVEYVVLLHGRLRLLLKIILVFRLLVFLHFLIL